MKNSPVFPLIITIASSKAEQGKSTVALVLAGMLAKTFKVLIIDLEQQGRLIGLRNKEIINEQHINLPYELIYLDPFYFFSAIPAYAARAELIIIEIPSRANLSSFADIFLLSNMLICPLDASNSNLETQEKFYKKIGQLKLLKREKGLPLKIYGVFNKFQVSHELKPQLDLAAKYDIPFFANFLKHSTYYQIHLSSSGFSEEYPSEEIFLLSKEFTEYLKDPSLLI